MVSRKALTSLKLEPASLQTAIQMLSLSVMETVGQYRSCQSKQNENTEFYTPSAVQWLNIIYSWILYESAFSQPH